MKKRKVISKEAIVNVAIKEFAKSGFALTTTDSIVNAAGISVGSLYNHFKNKVHLFEECVLYINETLEKLKRDEMFKNYQTNDEMLYSILFSFLNFFKTNKDFAKLYMIDYENFILAYPNSKVVDIKLNSKTDLEEVLAKNPNNKDLDSWLFASVFMGGLEYVIKQWIFHPTKFKIKDIEKLTEEMAKIYLSKYINGEGIDMVRKKWLNKKKD